MALLHTDSGWSADLQRNHLMEARNPAWFPAFRVGSGRGVVRNLLLPDGSARGNAVVAVAADASYRGAAADIFLGEDWRHHRPPTGTYSWLGGGDCGIFAEDGAALCGGRLLLPAERGVQLRPYCAEVHAAGGRTGAGIEPAGARR